MLFQVPLIEMQRLFSWLGGASTAASKSQFCLFGGPNPWITAATNWTAVDDRVRGGSSQSHLTPVENSTNVRFFGTLDTKTLGGAGFASQTTTGNKTWDLSSYAGLEVGVVKGDGKMYTLIVKDKEPEDKRDDGREKAGINWEYDFKVGDNEMEAEENLRVWIAWSDFKATYRGRERKDTGKLKTGEIKRFSLMMRSFFEKQEGDFELELSSISALKDAPKL